MSRKRPQSGLLRKGAQFGWLQGFAAKVKVERGDKVPCLITILNPPPERLPVGPPAGVVADPQMCVCHTLLRRQVPPTVFRLRRPPLSRTQFSVLGPRPWSHPARPTAACDLVLEIVKCQTAGAAGSRGGRRAGAGCPAGELAFSSSFSPDRVC